MSDIEKLQEQHTAGPQLIGFDYQFYYFMYLALKLKLGERVGFEVKDDVHIDREDGTTILMQLKHTIQLKEDGTSQNLTTLDSDLWKSLSNWAAMIKQDESILSNHYFLLVTNKSEGYNKFISALINFKRGDSDKIVEQIQAIGNGTKDKEIKKYVKNVLSLGKKRGKTFYSRLGIVTSIDDIINKVKMKILECIKNEDLVDAVFESLSSNMIQAKYVEIKNRKKFEITFDDFNNKFGKCFRVAFEAKPLPRRSFQINLPEKLEDQIFIKQLIDIGELDVESPDIVKYTTQMFQAMNHLSYWCDGNFILPTEMEEFRRESILKWENEFKSKYRVITRKIQSGTLIEHLADEIQLLGLEVIDFLRKEDLNIAKNTFGLELSNGHYYSLSNKPEIGWHFDWENKYKTT